MPKRSVGDHCPIHFAQSLRKVAAEIVSIRGFSPIPTLNVRPYDNRGQLYDGLGFSLLDCCGVSPIGVNFSVCLAARD